MLYSANQNGNSDTSQFPTSLSGSRRTSGGVGNEAYVDNPMLFSSKMQSDVYPPRGGVVGFPHSERRVSADGIHDLCRRWPTALQPEFLLVVSRKLTLAESFSHRRLVALI